MSLRDAIQSYDALKLNFIEIKNQYDLINIKYGSLSEEYSLLKRDMIFYEKEIKSKNETIESLKNDMISNTRRSGGLIDKEISFNSHLEDNEYYSGINNYNNNIKSNFNNYNNFKRPHSGTDSNNNTTTNNINKSKNYNETFPMINTNSNNNTSLLNSKDINTNINRQEKTIFKSNNSTNNNSNNNSNKNSFLVNNNEQTNNTNSNVNSFNIRNSNPSEKYINNNSDLERKINIFPSQKNLIQKEEKILVIETKLYNLQQERDKVKY
jgi:hypothetical protein